MFIDARTEFISYMKSQLIGPVNGPEENLVNDQPHKRYLKGILFPPAACVDETDESDGEESSTEALSNDFKPSSMAMSFAIENNSIFEVKITAGKYVKVTNKEWFRKPLEHFVEINLQKHEIKKLELFEGNGRLDITVRPYVNGQVVTVAFSNQAKSGEKLEPDKCLYQCGLSIKILDGKIKEYPSSDRFKLDEEQKELALTYRKRIPWAVGHGVAVDWDMESSVTPLILRTEAMPTHEVKGFSTDIDQGSYPELNNDILSIAKIANNRLAKPEDLLDGYDCLITAYEKWITELNDENLDHRYSEAKGRIIARLHHTANRMRSCIVKLRSNEIALKAFRLANEAMLMQMIHSGKNYAGTVKVRNTQSGNPDYYSEAVITEFNWRPFQLAFQLLVLESLIPDEHGVLPDSHEDVDLLWFPTGGGKTEAYLAVAAWEMIYRRLTQGDKGGGTAVIKRYTLRLLTSQQFQRAGSLVCAMEVLRKGNEKLGTEPFSLGLWAGQGSTPNEFKTAYDCFKLARDSNEPENSFQLQSCPWCGTQIFPKQYSDDLNEYGVRCNQNSKFEFFCPSNACEFNHILPIQVVDEALYANPPSLLIGTIDKFARITWKAEASAFFGNGKKSPPSLIIQDELHLISGPLGTIAGIYEAGFDSIMEILGRKPKVIAATATIRSAQQQSNRLFGRNVNIFPPSGTDEADSFFSKEDKDNPGRLYVGVMPSGHTGQTSLVQTAAVVLQAPQELGFKDDVLDSYWTLPIYHNSRRELGKTMTLARDDIDKRIEVISQIPRKIEVVEELSAGVKGSAIPEVLGKLNKSIFEGAIDVLPCTNMISVGVDISRLGTMIIAGQPKATAEYIQASSRVGRDKKRPPGIVITQYSPTKPRDRSHYETFKSYHQALYRHVEPTSVTPWAQPALERALHASLISVVRATGYLKENTSAKYFDPSCSKFKNIINIFKNRIEKAMNGMLPKERNDVFIYLQLLIDNWEDRAKRTQKPITHFDTTKSGKQFHPLIQPFETNSSEEAWKTLNSMRNVDTETHIFVRGENNGSL